MTERKSHVNACEKVNQREYTWQYLYIKPSKFNTGTSNHGNGNRYTQCTNENTKSQFKVQNDENEMFAISG